MRACCILFVDVLRIVAQEFSQHCKQKLPVLHLKHEHRVQPFLRQHVLDGSWVAVGSRIPGLSTVGASGRVLVEDFLGKF